MSKEESKEEQEQQNPVEAAFDALEGEYTFAFQQIEAIFGHDAPAFNALLGLFGKQLIERVIKHKTDD